MTIDEQIDEIVDRLIAGVRDESKRSRPWLRRPVGTWRPEQAAIAWKRAIRELIRSRVVGALVVGEPEAYGIRFLGDTLTDGRYHILTADLEDVLDE